MFEAEADPARNLLLMTFREHIGPAELAQGRVQVAMAVYLMTGDLRWPFHGHPQPMVPIAG